MNLGAKPRGSVPVWSSWVTPLSVLSSSDAARAVAGQTGKVAKLIKKQTTITIVIVLPIAKPPFHIFLQTEFCQKSIDGEQARSILPGISVSALLGRPFNLKFFLELLCTKAFSL